MKISCFTRYGPLNSKPIFGSLIKSMQDAGDTVLIDKDDNCDVAMIWSVLWQGRMAHYRPIWENYQAKNKPVIVVEVGCVLFNAQLYLLLSKASG